MRGDARVPRRANWPIDLGRFGTSRGGTSESSKTSVRRGADIIDGVGGQGRRSRGAAWMESAVLVDVLHHRLEPSRDGRSLLEAMSPVLARVVDDVSTITIEDQQMEVDAHVESRARSMNGRGHVESHKAPEYQPPGAEPSSPTAKSAVLPPAAANSAAPSQSNASEAKRGCCPAVRVARRRRARPFHRRAHVSRTAALLTLSADAERRDDDDDDDASVVHSAGPP